MYKTDTAMLKKMVDAVQNTELKQKDKKVSKKITAEEIKDDFWNCVDKVRRLKGIGSSDFARLLSLKPTDLSCYRAKKKTIPLDFAIKVANVLNCPISQLFCNDKYCEKNSRNYDIYLANVFISLCSDKEIYSLWHNYFLKFMPGLEILKQSGQIDNLPDILKQLLDENKESSQDVEFGDKKKAAQ